MPQILFLHGLESGPGGTKVVTLREQGLEVVAPDLEMSMWRLRKRRSVARSLLRLPEPRAAGGLALGSLLASLLGFGRLGALGLSGAAAWAGLRHRRWIGEALGLSRASCVARAREELQREAPIELVLGSSWGGAVAAELIYEGAWAGPTLLLAPAMDKAQERIDPAGLAPRREALRAHAQRAPLWIFHAPEDPTVPIAGSRALAEGSAIELVEIEGGGHRLLPPLEDGRLAEAIRQITAQTSPSTSGSTAPS